MKCYIDSVTQKINEPLVAHCTIVFSKEEEEAIGDDFDKARKKLRELKKSLSEELIKIMVLEPEV